LPLVIPKVLGLRREDYEVVVVVVLLVFVEVMDYEARWKWMP
jgi:hypothetical protein